MESIIAWNVNGMRSAHRLAGVRSFVSTVRDDTSILVLVDTRRSAIEAKKKRYMDIDWSVLPMQMSCKTRTASLIGLLAWRFGASHIFTAVRSGRRV